MKTARLFKDGTIVDAYDVFSGKVSRYNDFVDVEEDFRVVYWGGAKHKQGEPGRPHFKIYLSRDEYKRLSPEQKTRLQILKDQRHYQESEWHREWEDIFEEFAAIEKTITNEITKKRKRADAYLSSSNVCVEFQHSFINYDFEERNRFYKELGIKTVWVYDLTSQNVKNEDGTYTVLENNAKGFFRIAEDPDNLKNNIVFIQAKDKQLYLVKELRRKEIEGEKKSTIREFEPKCILVPNEFVECMRDGDFSFEENEKEIFDLIEMFIPSPSETKNVNIQYVPQSKAKNELKSVKSWWSPYYYFMILFNPSTNKYIRIEKGTKRGEMETIGKWNHILYQEVKWDSRTRKYTLINQNKYQMSWEEANDACWELVRGFKDILYY